MASVDLPRPILGQILTGMREPQPFFSSKEAAKKHLEDRITARRNQFIQEYRQRVHGNHVLTYEPALDREVYKELGQHKDIHADAYQEAVRGLNCYTKFQIETFIGERLNVGLSRFRYDLRLGSDGRGVMHGQGMEEPLLDMIARGRDTRNEVSGDIDRPRQIAEVTQFEKIQEVMGNPEAIPGTTIVSFSPPGKEGSAYSHNFYDVFILKEDANKERYVEARRYASGLSVEESLKKADEIQPGFSKDLAEEDSHVDAFLISHPVVMSEVHEFFDKPDNLHKALQGDTNAMSYEDFQRKVAQDELFTAMVNHYIQTLEEDPSNEHVLNTTLNAIMNRADEAAGLREAIVYPSPRRGRREEHGRIIGPIVAQIAHYGRQEVRQTATGCGSSGGFGTEGKGGVYGSSRLPSNMSKTKSSDVASGEDKYGSRTFDCPTCGYTNTRPYNELLPECQNPGECSNRKAVACQ